MKSLTAYETDLSDAEWAIVESMIPPAKPGGHPRTTDMRAVCNGIYYQLKTGCQWAGQCYPMTFLLVARSIAITVNGNVMACGKGSI